MSWCSYFPFLVKFLVFLLNSLHWKPVATLEMRPLLLRFATSPMFVNVLLCVFTDFPKQRNRIIWRPYSSVFSELCYLFLWPEMIRDFLNLVYWDITLLSLSGWPGTLRVDQTGFELPEICLPLGFMMLPFLGIWIRDFLLSWTLSFCWGVCMFRACYQKSFRWFQLCLRLRLLCVFSHERHVLHVVALMHNACCFRLELCSLIFIF